MSAFKITPPRPLVDPDRLAAFAAGAEVRETASERRIAAFSMRFTPSELARLKHISATTPDSMHEFCLKAIQRALAEFEVR